ncbi:enoyl-CoA hydratase [Striga asiatica]|uniref:Enoyl-CoA hydratase n=1 Tax=Striga asiatica TaxID=4170 RepID=A0A5A7Q5D0_STRAF|nr:enoyl-CoA hydratase [Striga asiatica]
MWSDKINSLSVGPPASSPDCPITWLFRKLAPWMLNNDSFDATLQSAPAPDDVVRANTDDGIRSMLVLGGGKVLLGLWARGEKEFVLELSSSESLKGSSSSGESGDELVEEERVRCFCRGLLILGWSVILGTINGGGLEWACAFRFASLVVS